MKRYIFPIYIFLILFFIFPSACAEGAKNGLLLWFNTIIPAIFPFILITALLRAFGGITYFEKIFGTPVSKLFGCTKRGAYAVIIGFLCGYPLGAKAVADSYSLGYIDRHEADYLLTFCNNPSPMYIYNYVVTAALGCGGLAPAFFLATYISTWLTGMLVYLLAYKKYRPLSGHTRIHTLDFSPNLLLEQCITDALATIQKIGVYMIIFSIISSLIFLLPKDLLPLKLLLTGLCEQTTGIHKLCISSLPLQTKAVLSAVFCSFGGFAVAAQTYGVISSQRLSLKPYLIGKTLHAVLTGGLIFIFSMWMAAA